MQKHDACGNLIDDGEKELFYDFANRLVQVKIEKEPELSENWLWRYDALGRRVFMYYDYIIEESRYFWYDGQQVIYKDDDMTDTMAYVYGIGIDEALMLNILNAVPQEKYYYHFNQLGSVTALTDVCGDVVERYEYDVYGMATIRYADGSEVESGSSTVGNPYMFTGRRYDSNSYGNVLGLYHYRARAYSPQTGRFLQRDPAQDDVLLNLYTYINNTPAERGDPSGLGASADDNSNMDTKETHKKPIIVNIFSYDTTAETSGERAGGNLFHAWWSQTVRGRDFISPNLETAASDIDHYFTKQPDGKCKCIGYLRVYGHGDTGVFFVGAWDIIGFYATGRGTIDEHISEHLQNLTKIAKHMCKDERNILIAGCCTAAGSQGKQTVLTISEIFDAEVTASKGMTYAWSWFSWGDWVTVKRGETKASWSDVIPAECAGESKKKPEPRRKATTPLP